MTSDRVALTAATVAQLVARQFPHWSHLPVTPVAQSGWDNHTFHLGATMKVRLPSAERYVAQVYKERAVLPKLAPHLPVRVPVPLAVGQPGAGFAWPWSIYGWLNGQTPSLERIADPVVFAEDLAGFLRALQAIDSADGPSAGEQNFHRGGRLAVYDAEARRSIEALSGAIDARQAIKIWERALASRWHGAPVWLHGDIAVGNLLVTDGKLSAVIDFGGCAVGDPACDLVIAWSFLDAAGRAAFQAALPYDADTWDRARGWALWKAMLMAERGQAIHPSERSPRDQIDLLLADND